MACVGFGKYYDDNMKAMGLTTHDTAYATFSQVMTDAGIIAVATSMGNGHLTMGQVFKGATGIMRFGAVAGVMASFYGGAMIGSSAVALSKMGACNPTVKDAITLLHKNGLYNTSIENELIRNPQILYPYG